MGEGGGSQILASNCGWWEMVDGGGEGGREEKIGRPQEFLEMAKIDQNRLVTIA